MNSDCSQINTIPSQTLHRIHQTDAFISFCHDKKYKQLFISCNSICSCQLAHQLWKVCACLPLAGHVERESARLRACTNHPYVGCWKIVLHDQRVVLAQETPLMKLQYVDVWVGCCRRLAAIPSVCRHADKYWWWKASLLTQRVAVTQLQLAVSWGGPHSWHLWFSLNAGSAELCNKTFD